MSISVDLAKAKTIAQQNVRDARKAKFAELDVEFQRATETSADTSAIVAKKQALRDAPAATALTGASDIAALKASWDTANLGDTPYKT